MIYENNKLFDLYGSFYKAHLYFLFCSWICKQPINGSQNDKYWFSVGYTQPQRLLSCRFEFKIESRNDPI